MKASAVIRNSHTFMQRRAWAFTRLALDHGLLIRQPCEVCGDPKSCAHHSDYTKPLEVRWLCNRHHANAQEHRENSKRLKALCAEADAALGNLFWAIAEQERAEQARIQEERERQKEADRIEWEVFTLSEAAEWLKLPQADVLQLVKGGRLGGMVVGSGRNDIRTNLRALKTFAKKEMETITPSDPAREGDA